MTDHSAARSKKTEPDTPSRQRMTADHRIRRNPSTDQKKDRRMMARQASETPLDMGFDTVYYNLRRAAQAKTGYEDALNGLLAAMDAARGDVDVMYRSNQYWIPIMEHAMRIEGNADRPAVVMEASYYVYAMIDDPTWGGLKTTGSSKGRRTAMDNDSAMGSEEVLLESPEQSDAVVAARRAILGGKTAAELLDERQARQRRTAGLSWKSMQSGPSTVHYLVPADLDRKHHAQVVETAGGDVSVRILVADGGEYESDTVALSGNTDTVEDGKAWVEEWFANSKTSKRASWQDKEISDDPAYNNPEARAKRDAETDEAKDAKAERMKNSSNMEMMMKAWNGAETGFTARKTASEGFSQGDYVEVQMWSGAWAPATIVSVEGDALFYVTDDGYDSATRANGNPRPIRHAASRKTATPNRGHKLMTAEIARKIPPLYSQDGKGKAATIYAKFFGIMSASAWTWYATEYDPDEGIFFGMVTSPMTPQGELGYLSLAELEDMSAMGGTLPLVERDLYFGDGNTLEDVTLGHVSSFDASRKTAAGPRRARAGEGAYVTDQHNSGIRSDVAPGTIANGRLAGMTMFGESYAWTLDGEDHGSWSLGGSWTEVTEASRKNSAKPRYELVDNNNPTWPGQSWNDLERAQKELARAVGDPGRWSLRDRQTKEIIATSSKRTAASSEQEIGNRLKDWVLGNPDCPHANVIASTNSIMPYECADCGYGMTRQDFERATGQMSMLGRKTSAVKHYVVQRGTGMFPTAGPFATREEAEAEAEYMNAYYGFNPGSNYVATVLNYDGPPVTPMARGGSRTAADQIADEDEAGLDTDPTWLDNEGQWQKDAYRKNDGSQSAQEWYDSLTDEERKEHDESGDGFKPADPNWRKDAAFGYSDAYNAGFEGGFTDGEWDDSLSTHEDYGTGWNAGSDALRAEQYRERDDQIMVEVYGPEGPTWQDRHDRLMDNVDQFGDGAYDSPLGREMGYYSSKTVPQAAMPRTALKAHGLTPESDLFI